MDEKITVINVEGLPISFKNPEVVGFLKLYKEKCHEYGIQNPIDYNVDIDIGMNLDSGHNVYKIVFPAVGKSHPYVLYDDGTKTWEFMNVHHTGLFENLTYTDIVRILIYQILN